MLQGKVAVVTGSTSGIGLGIARTLAEAGCDIVLNGFGDPSAIETERAQIAREFEVRAIFLPADLANAAEVAGMVEAAARELGPVDILVNNAGIQHTAPVENFPAERWDAVIAINLSANFHAIRAVLPQMRKRNWGRIVNIAPAHGLVASMDKAAYVAAKHGVGADQSRRPGDRNDRDHLQCHLSGLGPDPARPEADRRARCRVKIPVDQAKSELLSEKQPSHEFATPDQIGALTVFRCSKSPPRSAARRFRWTAAGPRSSRAQ